MNSIYLIPNTLGDSEIKNVIPEYNLQVINSIDTYIVENIKVARRFLVKCGIEKAIDDLTFFILDKRKPNILELTNAIKKGTEKGNIGIISDAGCPGVADPGAEAIKVAHQHNIKVVPLVGPSSILMAIMGSGFNGQAFTFHGYIPRERHERNAAIHRYETAAFRQNITQIFMDTPFRNNHVLEDLLAKCHPNTRLCIACDITLETEYIKTKTIKEWKEEKIDLHKRPCLFLLG